MPIELHVQLALLFVILLTFIGYTVSYARAHFRLVDRVKEHLKSKHLEFITEKDLTYLSSTYGYPKNLKRTFILMRLATRWKLLDALSQEGDFSCDICFRENIKRYGLYPCGHSLCIYCATTVKVCPYCRGEIEDAIVIHV